MSSSCQIVCLQETKLASVSSFDAFYIGGNRLKGFAERPANGTRGGILLLWDDTNIQITNISITEFCLSADVHLMNTSHEGDFKITTVYGPTTSNRKDHFFAELVAQKTPVGVRWLALGDFNQIRRACDKNKRNVNRSRITRFQNALHDCELKEIHLQNRRFTWSNGRANATLCKLDAFYCNLDWDIRFDTHVLHALSSSLSDHCPLLLADDSGPRKPHSFKFENFWPRIPGFDDVVHQAWNEPTTHTEPCHILHHKLKKTGFALSKWGRHRFSNTKVMLHAALLVILHFDKALESRQLSDDERDLHTRLKRKVVALAVIERARKKQCSRITNIKEGDANTKYFHLKVNARRRKNHIYRLKHNQGWVTHHFEKDNVVHNHFKGVIDRGEPRKEDFNWEEVHFEESALEGLGDPFTEDEVKNAIDQMPIDKAPGPDGFTGLFFKKCWYTIKHDVMKVVLEGSRKVRKKSRKEESWRDSTSPWPANPRGSPRWTPPKATPFMEGLGLIVSFNLPPSYKNFVMNYNMQNMNKELPELFAMLKSAEIEIKKEHQVLMVNKTTSFKKQGKSKGKNKKGGKKAATPPVKPKAGPKPDVECYYCKEKGHWKRNCSKYLADPKSGLVKKKKEEFLTKEVTGRKVELDEIDESSLVDRSSADRKMQHLQERKLMIMIMKLRRDSYEPQIDKGTCHS
ncbi:hypothetical protein QYE76_062457 [Lolium multiflorum]|uniref:CCHC-type domain-containing protein n=1 Tax=Lolium multiflorum TaxID=4521 RepID=A0AAD8S5Q5_LOLMU|nr:hypothetical protein QYE76_062457 [Lolium multiflorum]